MPTIGSFHRKYWGTRSNTPIPPGPPQPWMYPIWQSSVTMCMSIWGVSFETIRPLLERFKWTVVTLWRLSRQSPESAERLLRWSDRFEVYAASERDLLAQWAERWSGLDVQQRAVVDRVVTAITSPEWGDCLDRVRACATTPRFHRAEEWVPYSRALKANAGQAQNVFRHIKVVHELSDAHPTLTNPEKHLLAELAYQGFAACPPIRSPRAAVS